MKKMRLSLLIVLVAIPLAVTAQDSQQPPSGEVRPGILTWTVHGSGFSQLSIVGARMKRLPDGKDDYVEYGIAHDVDLTDGMVRYRGQSHPLIIENTKMVKSNVDIISAYVARTVQPMFGVTRIGIGSMTVRNENQLEVEAAGIYRFMLFLSIYELRNEAEFTIDLKNAKLTPKGGDTRDIDKVAAEMIYGNVNAISMYALGVMRTCQKTMGN